MRRWRIPPSRAGGTAQARSGPLVGTLGDARFPR
jgi:hypothetical protein